MGGGLEEEEQGAERILHFMSTVWRRMRCVFFLGGGKGGHSSGKKLEYSWGCASMCRRVGGNKMVSFPLERVERHMDAHTSAQKQRDTRTYLQTCIHTHTHTRMCLSECFAKRWIRWQHALLGGCVHVCVRVCLGVYVCVRASVGVCLYVWVFVVVFAKGSIL